MRTSLTEQNRYVPLFMLQARRKNEKLRENSVNASEVPRSFATES